MTKLYNANDGINGRTGGPYLDIEQAEQAEIRRAKAEGRKPDFENMAAGAGIQLVTAGHLMNVIAGVNVSSEHNVNPVNAQAAVDGIVADKDSHLTVFSDDKPSVAHTTKK